MEGIVVNNKWALLLLCSIMVMHSSERAPKTVAAVPLADSWISNSCEKSMDCAVRRSIEGGTWYAIYGGNDGKQVVERLVPNLHTWFEQASGATVKKMKDAFAQANRQDGYGQAGSSVAVVFIDKDKTVHIAHLGDCGVALIQNGIVQKITKAHTALNEAEVARINKLNITDAMFAEAGLDSRYNRTYQEDDWRSDVTRSIGGHLFFNQEAITSEPEVESFKLTDPEGQIILGSYGFWKDFPTERDGQTAEGLKKYVSDKLNGGVYKDDGSYNEACMTISLGKEFDRWREVKSNIWRSFQFVGVAGLVGLLSYYLSQRFVA